MYYHIHLSLGPATCAKGGTSGTNFKLVITHSKTLKLLRKLGSRLVH